MKHEENTDYNNFSYEDDEISKTQIRADDKRKLLKIPDHLYLSNRYVINKMVLGG